MADIFGVSTDYLLKDEIVPEDMPAQMAVVSEIEPPRRRVELEEANEYLDISERTAPVIAAGVFLCIISPVVLIVLSGMAEYGILKISENAAAGIGIVALLLLIAIAVTLFIVFGGQKKEFEYLEKETFETAYGVDGMVRERLGEYKTKYTAMIATGVALCITGVLPLILTSLMGCAEWIVVLMVGVLLFIIGVAVVLFVNAGCIMGSYNVLLKQGDYSDDSKTFQKKMEPIASIYWCGMTGLYFVWSFIWNAWHISWIIWPVAGVCYGLLMAIMKAAGANRK